MRVKVCGITNLEDAFMAADLGAFALGFNFYKPSPRYIVPALAAKIIKQLPKEIVSVGVFVNSSVKYMSDIKQETGIQIVQLHGDETSTGCKQIQGPIIKTIKDDVGIEEFNGVYALLIDAKVAGQFGGTGKRADWKLARDIAKKHPTILAGGLNAENISAAISAVNPMAVDLCSGVEASPGVKSREKLVQFFAALT